VKIIIIGLGNQGRKRQIVAGEDVVATVDLQNSLASYSDIRQVPLDSFDAGFVCTSDDAKFGIVEYLLANGKHAFIEKPFLLSDCTGFQKLLDLARNKRVVCYTAYNHRFEPHIAKLKELVDSGDLGQIYLARFFYGNGTARDVRESAWRDQHMGVLSDLGSHLLDLSLFLFGEQRRDFVPWNLACFENRAFDHAFFGAVGKLTLKMEVSLLSWRNSFNIDIYGEKGSAHIDCLCKWGASTFTVRERMLPSGKPSETRHVLECADPTWTFEYQHFMDLCQKEYTSLDKDLWISTVLEGMVKVEGERSVVDGHSDTIV
jgi:scyllo-inositol 2-dehydrogenase (NADP+)